MDQPGAAQVGEVLRPWLGTAAPVLLGEGMEGRVWALGPDRVAKVWSEPGDQGGDQGAVRRFLDALRGRSLPFSVPEVLDQPDPATTAGWRVTIERRLPGTTLASRLADGSATDDAARDAVVDVLAALALVGPLPEARALGVLGEDAPLRTEGQGPAEALGRLVRRRVGQAAGPLVRAVPRLDVLVDAVVERLVEVHAGRLSPVHGDLFPGNVLVADDAAATAVLDWGFLTTEADPALDAAVACAIFDMYGEGALATELDLLARVEDRLGLDRATLLVHRAAYALATATAYDPEGGDGHFAWCVAGLQRPDVVRVLLG